VAEPDTDPHFFGSWIRIRIKKSKKFRGFRGSKWSLETVDAQNGGVEAQIEPWRVCRPVVINSHNLDDEQDPDLDPRLSENWCRIRIQVDAKPQL
jgi:hypothetical protein